MAGTRTDRPKKRMFRTNINFDFGFCDVCPFPSLSPQITPSPVFLISYYSDDAMGPHSARGPRRGDHLRPELRPRVEARGAIERYTKYTLFYALYRPCPYFLYLKQENDIKI